MANSAVAIKGAGPPAMIEAMRVSFPRHGLPAQRLYFDSFDYAPDSLSRRQDGARLNPITVR